MQLVDSVGILIMPLTPMPPTNIYSLFSTDFPELGLMFGCGALYLFPELLDEDFDNNRARQQSMSMEEHCYALLHYFFSSSHVWFYPRSVGNPACGSWSSGQYVCM